MKYVSWFVVLILCLMFQHSMLANPYPSSTLSLNEGKLHNKMNAEIDSKLRAISKLFKNADVLLDEYKCSKDPSIPGKLNELVKRMRPSFEDLNNAVAGCDSSKRQALDRLLVVVEKGPPLFSEQIAKAREAEPEVPFRARHMYRDTPSHQLFSDIDQAVADLFAAYE